MPKLFWTYAGRMAFSILCSLAGALLVAKLGLLQPAAPKLEKIVFDQSDLTRYGDIVERVEAGHIALRELKAKQEAEARRQADMETAERHAAAEQARSRAAALATAQAERSKKAPAMRREAIVTAPVAAPAAPLVITPTVAAERPLPRDGLDGMFDKLASGVGKIRDFVVNAVRTEKPANLPFGSASAASDSVPVIDDMRSRLRLPAFEL